MVRLRLQNDTHFIEFRVPGGWVWLGADRIRIMRKQGFYPAFKGRHLRVIEQYKPDDVMTNIIHRRWYFDETHEFI